MMIQFKMPERTVRIYDRSVPPEGSRLRCGRSTYLTGCPEYVLENPSNPDARLRCDVPLEPVAPPSISPTRARILRRLARVT